MWMLFSSSSSILLMKVKNMGFPKGAKSWLNQNENMQKCDVCLHLKKILESVRATATQVEPSRLCRNSRPSHWLSRFFMSTEWLFFSFYHSAVRLATDSGTTTFCRSAKWHQKSQVHSPPVALSRKNGTFHNLAQLAPPRTILTFAWPPLFFGHCNSLGNRCGNHTLRSNM